MRTISVWECVEHECTDGAWRNVHGMPFGMTTTGKTRIVGYALTDGSTSFGIRRPTRDEAQLAADQENARLAECEVSRLACIAERQTERETAARARYLELTETGRIDALYGPSNAGARADILSLLFGEHVAKSKALWGKFRDAMLRIHGIGVAGVASQDAALTRAANPDYDAQQAALMARLDAKTAAMA